MRSRARLAAKPVLTLVSALVLMLAGVSAAVLVSPALAAAQEATTRPAPAPSGPTLPPPPILAPPAGFAAAGTGRVRILAEAGGPISAAEFAVAWGPALEAALGEIGAVVTAPDPDRPLVLVLYAADESFAEAAATAPDPPLLPTPAVAGVLRGDIAVSVPALQAASPLEAEGALRHAAARVALDRASGWRLPRGFGEGFAAYAERPPTAELARAAALVQNARAGGDLLSWSDLNRPQPPQADPAVFAAHAYSVVGFLVERYGLRQVGEFVAALDAEPDWRSAARTVYKRAPAELEAQWEEQLPRWTAGGWRDNLFAAFDLGPAEALLARGHYAAAGRELEASLRLFNDLQLADRQAAVAPLLRQAETGLQAEALMEQTEQALGRHAYDRADALLAQARAQYAELPPQRRPTGLLDRYGALAAQGLESTARLDAAADLSDSWRDYPSARAAALAAGGGFAALGDQAMYDRAAALLQDLDGRQTRLTLTLGLLALLSAVWLALWLWARGRSDLDWGP
jgi:hypothetical protein